MRLLHMYLGGWAFVLGASLIGIAGAGGTDDPPSITATYEKIIYDPVEFVSAIAIVWAIYSLPFLAALVFQRMRSRA